MVILQNLQTIRFGEYMPLCSDEYRLYDCVDEKKYDEQSFDDALERIHLILEDHDYFNLDRPLWYKSKTVDNVTGL